jgi:hypothetical protein
VAGGEAKASIHIASIKSCLKKRRWRIIRRHVEQSDYHTSSAAGRAGSRKTADAAWTRRQTGNKVRLWRILLTRAPGGHKGWPRLKECIETGALLQCSKCAADKATLDLNARELVPASRHK